jgi:uncharacterized protein (DUF1778 family)
MPSKPVVNLRYQSQAQLIKFKKAAKLCRWSLNTFLLAAADRYAFQILSRTPEASQEPPLEQEGVVNE